MPKAVAPRTAPPRQGGPTEIDDRTLLGAKAGDPGAFRAFVRLYEGRVVAQLAAMLRPAQRGHLVDDLAQETFLRAFRALPRFEIRGHARPSSWLLTIATRLCLNELRRRPAPIVPLDTVTEFHGRVGIDPATRDQTGRAIERAVAGLRPAHRAAFLLREVHGLDYGEIAAALEVDIGTVKSRLSRARAALRRSLAEVYP